MILNEYILNVDNEDVIWRIIAKDGDYHHDQWAILNEEGEEEEVSEYWLTRKFGWDFLQAKEEIEQKEREEAYGEMQISNYEWNSYWESQTNYY